MRAVIVVIGILAGAGQLHGQAIEKACLHSDRDAKSRPLCDCIQQAADLMLSEPDQKLAASFYRDTDLAQQIRQSNRRSHENFWDRYKEYAATATKYCG